MVAEPSRRRWWVLVHIVALNILVTGIGWNYVIMVVEQLIEDLGVDISTWGTLWSAISLGVVLFSIPAGALGDRIGARRALGIGAALAGASLLLRARALEVMPMFLAMLGFGLALGLVLTNFPKAIAQWFPASELGMANGVSQAGVGVGLGAAAMLTPILLEPLGGWRNLTELLGVVSLVLAALWLFALPDPSGGGGAARAQPRHLLASIGHVMRIRDIRLLALCYLLYVGGYLGAIGYLPLHFVRERGMSPEAAGVLMSLGPWSFIVGSLLLPTLSDRLGLRRAVYLPGMLAGGLALLSTCYALGLSLAVAMVALGFCTGVVGLLFAIPAEMRGVGESLAGSAVGVVTTAGFLGGFLSPQIGMALAARGVELGFFFWTLCFAASALLILAVSETGPRAQRHS
jgi:nitrate/nitrite transporter NarK